MSRRRPLGCVLAVERAGQVHDLAVVAFAASEPEAEEATLVVLDCDTQRPWTGALSPAELAEVRRALALDFRLQAGAATHRAAFAAVGAAP